MSYVYTELTMREEQKEQKNKTKKQAKLLTHTLKKVCGMGMFGLFHKSYIPKHENKSPWLCLWHIWPFGKVFW